MGVLPRPRVREQLRGLKRPRNKHTTLGYFLTAKFFEFFVFGLLGVRAGRIPTRRLALDRSTMIIAATIEEGKNPCFAS